MAQRRKKTEKAVRNPLTEAMLLEWADAFFATHGYWPSSRSGLVAGQTKANWRALDVTLRKGGRGFPGGSSLSDFLNEHRGLYQGGKSRPYQISEGRRIDMKMVMRWAREYRKKTGIWPHLASGDIREFPGYTWGLLDMALRFGRRGLPGGTSLSQLFGPKKKVQPKNRKKPKKKKAK